MLKKKIFISGITGTMGEAALKHMINYRDKLDIVSIVRDTKENRKKMEKYKEFDIDIVWGDIRKYEDVKKALRAVDYILHLAALVSPKADYKPKLAWEINVGSIENILRAIGELGLLEVKLVYIGSVAQTGSRLPPLHWGRVGDPLKPSIFDNYAVSKIAGERKVIESGLKYWVSLRQTGILHYGLASVRDGIIFHQPLNNVLEWITEEDSARMLLNICTKDLPEEFWKKVYNVGGGESCRLNNLDFTSKILRTMGVKDIEKIFEASWFASKNFHGQYYLDSYILNDYLDFRKESIEDFLVRLEKSIEFPNTLMRYLSPFFIKKYIMKPIAYSKYGSLNWIKTKDMDRINAFWGSLDDFYSIKTWEDVKVYEDYSKIVRLSHGYDEDKNENLLNIEDMQKAAIFRGGKCLSSSMLDGDMDTKLEWECSFSHKFYASPRLVLKTGHWCQECEAPPWNFDEIAKHNPFFAQVWRE